jgi:hypothetical protein
MIYLHAHLSKAVFRTEYRVYSDLDQVQVKKWAARYWNSHTVKKGYRVSRTCSRDVNYQTLPGRELLSYSWPGRVWLLTSRLQVRETR